MLQMTKEVEKTTLYRLLFEICSVTTFFKNPVYSVTKPSVTPSSIRALIKILQCAILTETEFYTILTYIEGCIKSRGGEAVIFLNRLRLRLFGQKMEPPPPPASMSKKVRPPPQPPLPHA